jgi:hypothetical protein
MRRPGMKLLCVAVFPNPGDYRFTLYKIYEVVKVEYVGTAREMLEIHDDEGYTIPLERFKGYEGWVFSDIMNLKVFTHFIEVEE